LPVVAFVCVASGAALAVELKAPLEASAGAELAVSHSGASVEPTDFISIDRPGAPHRDYGPYVYAKTGNPVTLRAPDLPGAYEIRYHRGAANYAVDASAPLTVKDVQATIEAPAQVDAGATFKVTFSGPNNKGDFIGVDRAGAADRDYGPYVYSSKGSPAEMRAPDEPGSYLVRYHLGQSYRVIASSPLTVGATGATLEAPPGVTAGSEVTVAWTGPAGEGDFVSIDKAGAPDRD
jgi:Ca-activated chloride channel family protein